MAPQGSVWDHSADKDLLLTIIEEGSFKWDIISAKMSSKGYTFTKEAVRQHFQKIRKEARASAPSNASGPSINATTPKSRKRSTASTPRSKGKLTTESFGSSINDENDDEEQVTPLKRKRTVKKEEKGDAEEEYGGYAGYSSGYQVAYLKREGEGDKDTPINLENDELYEDDSYS